MQTIIDSNADSNYESDPSDNMPLPPEDRFNSEQELQDMIQEWAARHGFAFIKRRSQQRNQAGRRKVVWYCNRKGEAPEILRYNGGQLCVQLYNNPYPFSPNPSYVAIPNHPNNRPLSEHLESGQSDHGAPKCAHQSNPGLLGRARAPV